MWVVPHGLPSEEGIEGTNHHFLKHSGDAQGDVLEDDETVVAAVRGGHGWESTGVVRGVES